MFDQKKIFVARSLRSYGRFTGGTVTILSGNSIEFLKVYEAWFEHHATVNKRPEVESTAKRNGKHEPVPSIVQDA